MRIALITPWKNAWVPYFREAIERRGHEFVLAKPGQALNVDVVLHGWASGDSKPLEGARNIVFLRRYELFEGGLGKIDWKKVDALVVVNNWIKEVVERIFADNSVKTPVHLIYNGTDVGRWRWKERAPNHRIGMACHVHPKKNLPLALQVLARLPEQYELHIAGEVQDACTAEYLNHLGQRLRRKVFIYGHVEASQLSLWWEQMGVCLSTSLSEGNPNNVIEAMAKGIKPVVHAWPGAEDQFGGHLFNTAEEAAAMITSAAYDSLAYRALVEQKFSLANIERAVDLALSKETACAS
jgi:glycosyltransferase involved in cell wall biosynthesis